MMNVGETLAIGNTSHPRLGEIWVAFNQRGLCAVKWHVTEAAFVAPLLERYQALIVREDARVEDLIRQIDAYLAGKQRAFHVPIDWSLMTPFQVRVYRATRAIPYGETRSYAEIAAQTGNMRAARAVGRAEALNPVPLVVPCHRVIGSDGKLHGFGGFGGLETKAWLLNLEKSRLTE